MTGTDRGLRRRCRGERTMLDRGLLPLMQVKPDRSRDVVARLI